MWNLELKQKQGKVEDYHNVSLIKAIKLSREFKIPLYPKFICYWTEISLEQFEGLISWLKKSKFENKLILPYNKTEKETFEQGKRALELLGVPHETTIENVIMKEEISKAFLFNIGITPR